MRFGIIIQEHDHIARAITDGLPDWRKKSGLLNRNEAQKTAVRQVKELVEAHNRFVIVPPVHHQDLVRNACLDQSRTHCSSKVGWPLKRRDREGKPWPSFGNVHRKARASEKNSCPPRLGCYNLSNRRRPLVA